MEEKRSGLAHQIVLNNREELGLTGIMDVLSFDEDMVIVETEYGILEIKGEDLHVNQLSLERGELNLSGIVLGLLYSEQKTFEKAKESLITRLFS